MFEIISIKRGTLPLRCLEEEKAKSITILLKSFSGNNKRLEENLLSCRRGREKKKNLLNV